MMILSRPVAPFLHMLPDELGLLSDATGMEAEPGFGGSAVPVDGSMDGGFGAESSSSASSSSKVEAPTGMCSCFTVAYYQPFFNVNTSDVQDRLKGTLAFHQREPTFLSVIGDTPDLYGPFWVATSLIFIISVTSNLARTLQSGYTYDFQVSSAVVAAPLLLPFPGLSSLTDLPVFSLSLPMKLVTYCVTLIYGYLILVPGLLYAACKYFIMLKDMGFVRLLCLVGYSLFLYIPACIVSTITMLAWPALGAASGLSTLFLLRSLLPLMTSQKEKATTVVVVVCAIQVIFLLIIKTKFYTSGFSV